MEVDQARLEAFQAAISAALVLVGVKRGLYKALAERGPSAGPPHRSSWPPSPGGRRRLRPRGLDRADGQDLSELAARHIRDSLAPDGTWLLVEPNGHDYLADNLNPFGRIFCSASTICTPASLSQEVGLGLGAQAGESRLRQVAEDAGFTHFKRAAETPFNLVFDVRP